MNPIPVAEVVAFSVYSLNFVAASVAVSYLSYRYIESPFLRHKPK